MAIVYTKTEEKAHVLSHASGILIGLIAGLIFFRQLYPDSDLWAFAGIVLYLIGMLSSYTASTVYHALPAGSKRKEPMRKWDHAAIYWHIAGSYAPFTLIALRQDSYWGWGLSCFVGLCALAGTWMSFRNLKEHSNLETCCFIGMGLVVLVAFQPLTERVGWEIMGWILAEGAFFIAGAVFYTLHRLSYMHFVFHLLVVGGTLSHIMAIWHLLAL